MDFPETDTENFNMDSDKVNRKTSILKPNKPRNPLSTVDLATVSPDVTFKASRRVSFARRSSIKPFKSDVEENTVWDTTYQEEVCHTDSSLKSSENTNVSPTEAISNSSETETKTESKGTIYVDEAMDMTCVKSKVENKLNKSTVIIDKENVNPIINDLTILKGQPVADEKQFVDKSAVFEESLTADNDLVKMKNYIFDDSRDANESISFFDVIRNEKDGSDGKESKVQSNTKAILFNEPEDMEITANLQCVNTKIRNNTTIFFNDNSDMEFTTNLSEKISKANETVADYKLATTVQFNESHNMDFTTNLPVQLVETKKEKEILEKKIIEKENIEKASSSMGNTIYFNNSADMEFTLNNQATNLAEDMKENIVVKNPIEIFNESIVSNKTKTMLFSEDQDQEMELTKVLDLPGNNLVTVDKKVNNEEMKKIKSAGRKTIFYNANCEFIENSHLGEFSDGEETLESSKSSKNTAIIKEQERKEKKTKELEKLDISSKPFEVFQEDNNETSSTEQRDKCLKNISAHNQNESLLNDSKKILNLEEKFTKLDDLKEDLNLQEIVQQDITERVISTSICEISVGEDDSEQLSSRTEKNDLELESKGFEEDNETDLQPAILKVNQEDDEVKQISDCVSEICLEKSDLEQKTKFTVSDDLLEERNSDSPRLNTRKKLVASGTSTNNILYTEPGRKLTMPTQNYCLTPHSSFGINLTNMSPCMENEDTQQLIRDASHFKNCSDLETESIALNRNDLSADRFDSFVDETTPPILIVDDDLTSSCDLDSTQSPSVEKMIDFDVVDTLSNDCSSESSSNNDLNYTFRSQSVLFNIKKMLVRPKFKLESKNFDRAAEKYKEYKEILGKISRDHGEFFKTAFLDLEEHYKESQEKSEMQSMRQSLDESVMVIEDNSPLMAGLRAPRNLFQIICESEERNKKWWQLLDVKDDCYSFVTLYQTLFFNVRVDSKSGVVCDIDTKPNLADDCKSICWYVLKCLEEQLKQENLSSHLGPKYDILTLLDYITIIMEKINAFHNEFKKLEETYRRSHHFRMNPDFSVIFKIMDIDRVICWIIKVQLSFNSVGSKVDVTATDKIGEKVNEADIKEIAENTVKGPEFLRNFIENVENYVYKFRKY